MMKEYQHVVHTFKPVYDHESKILILGSFPSVMSRQHQFYYGHPGNRFWKVITRVINEQSKNKDKSDLSEVPITIEDKKNLLLKNRIALWDVIYSCDIIGSSDSSIKNVVVNDINSLINESNITEIYVNGKTAQRLYDRFCFENVQIPAIVLPSTSPANAAYSIERLFEIWNNMVNIQK